MYTRDDAHTTYTYKSWHIKHNVVKFLFGIEFSKWINIWGIDANIILYNKTYIEAKNRRCTLKTEQI